MEGGFHTLRRPASRAAGLSLQHDRTICGDAMRLWLLSRTAGWRLVTYSVLVDRAEIFRIKVLFLGCLPALILAAGTTLLVRRRSR